MGQYDWKDMSPRMKRDRTSTLKEVAPEDWEVFGVRPTQVEGWKSLGFEPFEAALAQGDGYTPAFAVDYRQHLQVTATWWTRVGLASVEGLRWHRAGFGAKEAARWRLLGVDVEAARGQRAGYGTIAPSMAQLKRTEEKAK